MNLLRSLEHGVLRVRVTDCGCGEPECDKQFLFATTHEVLWLAVGIIGRDEAPAQAEAFLMDLQLDADLARALAQGIALFGQTWPVLTSSRDRAVAQMRAYEDVPDYMRRVPVREVWAVRRVVFGDDLTRVPWALACLDSAYVQERPAVRKGAW
jgi:hypothetical protein